MDLLDEIMPTWHYGNHHQLVVDAPQELVAAAIESYDVGRDASWLVRAFVRARGLKLPDAPGPRETLVGAGFSLLAELPGREIVFGVAGKFWAPCEMANLVRVPDVEAFKGFASPGQAKGAINIRVASMGDARTLLSTETRVWCSDRRARLLFGAYWALIRIPSSIIRGDMLRSIARRATSPSLEPIA